MFKKLIIIFLVIVGMLMLSVHLYRKELQSRSPTLEESLSSERWKQKVAGDEYLTYNSKRNIEEGMSDGLFFPCPKGYDCERLVPKEYKTEGQNIIFDECEVNECMNLLRKTVYAYGVDDIDEYLSERKIWE